MEAQVQHFQAMGYEAGHISIAMEAANMDRGAMVSALESLSKGRGVPEDVAGVWTIRDDKDLRRVKNYDDQAMKGKGPADYREHSNVTVKASNLVEKHTNKGMEVRWKFLKMLNKTGDF